MSKKYTPFKMKGFSGFGNSPMKQTEVKEKKGITINPPWDFGGTKRLIKEAWRKHGPVINHSTKNPKGVGK